MDDVTIPEFSPCDPRLHDTTVTIILSAYRGGGSLKCIGIDSWKATERFLVGIAGASANGQITENTEWILLFPSHLDTTCRVPGKG